MDVSWHITANPAPGQLNNFIMEPNLAAAVGVSGAGLIGRYAQCCVLSLKICSGAWKGAGVSVELPKVHHGSISFWKLCACWLLCCQAVRFVLDNASFQQLKGVLHGILLSVLPSPLCTIYQAVRFVLDNAGLQHRKEMSTISTTFVCCVLHPTMTLCCYLPSMPLLPVYHLQLYVLCWTMLGSSS